MHRLTPYSSNTIYTSVSSHWDTLEDQGAFLDYNFSDDYGFNAITLHRFYSQLYISKDL